MGCYSMCILLSKYVSFRSPIDHGEHAEHSSTFYFIFLPLLHCFLNSVCTVDTQADSHYFKLKDLEFKNKNFSLEVELPALRASL